jgi:hypothetical protein
MMSQSIAVNQNRSSGLAWWSAITILLSAFLLFQVQPVITKKILPWFGGSPAVWTTCVLFFQLVLLGGYAYAHVLTHRVQPRWQAMVHLAVVVIAMGLMLLFFPPAAVWKPADGRLPALRILMLLTAVVAAPYFVLSTTGPLIQAWFARLYPGRSPYRLYSLSNIGSLAALLSYPFAIEWLMKVDTQAHVWSIGFIAFATLIAILALGIWRFDNANPPSEREEPAVTTAEGLITKRSGKAADATVQVNKSSSDAPPRTGLRVSWLLLAALASMAFLAITNHLCQDIAVVPFMWVIPLSLYLLSFIICFDNERWYLRKTFGVAAILMILWLTAIKEYQNVNEAMEYGQRLIVATFTRPTFDDAAEAETYTKKSFAEKVRTADLHGRYVGIWVGRVKLIAHLPITFSKTNDKFFDGIGWAVGKINKGRDVRQPGQGQGRQAHEGRAARSTSHLARFVGCKLRWSCDRGRVQPEGRQARGQVSSGVRRRDI